MKSWPKKYWCILCASLLIVSLLAGCSRDSSQESSVQPESENVIERDVNTSEPQEPAEKTLVRVGTLMGPTGMGMVGVMDLQDQGIATNDYDFTIAGAAEEMTAKIISGELDIAAVPSNLASVLYNRTEGAVSVIAVNTLGVLYIMDKGNDVTSIEDLRGKTLNATGQAAAPEYVLNYILEQNGLTPGTDVEVVYRSEHSELATLMVSGDVTLAMLPQPFVTSVTNQDPEIEVALNLTEEWGALEPDASLAMGCLVVRNDFLENNKDAVDSFLFEYEESVAFVNRDIDDAAELMEKYDIIAQAVAVKAIPLCNIVYFTGDEMQSYISGFLEVLFAAEPQSVGGSLPDDAFYYKG